MTRTPSLLGVDYDAAAQLPDGLDHYRAKRSRALRELECAEQAGEGDVVKSIWWELGLIDLVLAPEEDRRSHSDCDRGGGARGLGTPAAISLRTVVNRPLPWRVQTGSVGKIAV
jgi:hypothetical protein